MLCVVPAGPELRLLARTPAKRLKF